MPKKPSISYALKLLHLSNHVLCQNKQQLSYSNFFSLLHRSVKTSRNIQPVILHKSLRRMKLSETWCVLPTKRRNLTFTKDLKLFSVMPVLFPLLCVSLTLLGCCRWVAQQHKTYDCGTSSCLNLPALHVLCYFHSTQFTQRCTYKSGCSEKMNFSL